MYKPLFTKNSEVKSKISEPIFYYSTKSDIDVSDKTRWRKIERYEVVVSDRKTKTLEKNEIPWTNRSKKTDFIRGRLIVDENRKSRRFIVDFIWKESFPDLKKSRESSVNKMKSINSNKSLMLKNTNDKINHEGRVYSDNRTILEEFLDGEP